MSDQTDTEQMLPEETEIVEQADEQAEDEMEGKDERNQDDNETAGNNNNNNPKPILYNLNISPVVRCVKIVARLINLELELRYEFFNYTQKIKII